MGMIHTKITSPIDSYVADIKEKHMPDHFLTKFTDMLLSRTVTIDCKSSHILGSPSIRRHTRSKVTWCKI